MFQLQEDDILSSWGMKPVTVFTSPPEALPFPGRAYAGCQASYSENNGGVKKEMAGDEAAL